MLLRFCLLTIIGHLFKSIISLRMIYFVVKLIYIVKQLLFLMQKGIKMRLTKMALAAKWANFFLICCLFWVDEDQVKVFLTDRQIDFWLSIQVGVFFQFMKFATSLLASLARGIKLKKKFFFFFSKRWPS